ncbi:MAG TPA: response regulator transcription factor [Steroidobacteraceae bacterium]|nr:response regulator transcription factor [Steroidobacteraceae bacterium]
MKTHDKTSDRMPKRVRVLIVDDHPLVREGLAARISSQPDLEVCGVAASSDEALALMRAMRPALVLLDLALQGSSGLDLIKQIRARAQEPKILVVSAYDEAVYAERALRAGAEGYINKQELQASVIEAIRTVLRGGTFMSAAVTQRLADRTLGRGAAPGPLVLTDRELQVFEAIGRGRTTREIAAALHLSVHTVESHREKIRLKLNLRNGTELQQRAVLWALENSR